MLDHHGYIEPGRITNKINQLIDAINNRTIKTNGTTAYTLLLIDIGTILSFSNGSAVTVTIPLDNTILLPFGGDTIFPVGGDIELMQLGAGLVTASPTGGVTLVGRTTTSAQNGRLILRRLGANSWIGL